METLPRVLIAIAIVVVAARLVGLLARRLGQPSVMGEIVAGILLGPSVLGAISEDAKDALFPAEIIPFLNIVAQLGLIFFLFLVGLELDPKLMRARGRTVGFVLPLSLATPFLLGIAIGFAVHDTLAPDVDRTGFVLFLGASLSITAFPVLARLLAEKDLMRTTVGAISLALAAVEDVCAWIILAVVVAVVKGGGPGGVLLTILYTAIFASVMLFLVRPGLEWLIARWRGAGSGGGLGAGLLTLVLVGVLVSAYTTERIGIHAIFGAFLFGAILPRRSELVNEVTLKIEDFTLLLFLPVFFAITGLKTELAAIDSATVAGIGLLILAAAIIGKFVAGLAGARASGMGVRDSSVLGLLMNTRGLTELVIISIGQELGVVPDSLFAILVLMALITTFMAAPLIDLVLRRPAPTFRPSTAGMVPGVELPRRILAALDGSAGDAALVDLAARLAEPTGATVLLARVLAEPERLAYRTSRVAARNAEELAASRLGALVESHLAAGVRIDTAITTVNDVGVGICRAAEKADADLVLVGWNKSLLGTNVLGGAVGTVLERCPAEVAVLVDQTGRGVALERGETVLAPFGGGPHEVAGVLLARRLATASGARLEVLEEDPGDAERAGVSADEGVVVTPAGGRGRAALAEALERAGVLVIGAGQDWTLQKQSFGGSRGRLVAGVVKPVVVVRSGDQAELERIEGWLKNARRSQVGDWLGTRTGSVPAPAEAERANV